MYLCLQIILYLALVSGTALTDECGSNKYAAIKVFFVHVQYLILFSQDVRVKIQSQHLKTVSNCPREKHWRAFREFLSY